MSRKRISGCVVSVAKCSRRRSGCTIAGMQRRLKGYTTRSPWKMTKRQLCKELNGFYSTKGRVYEGYRGSRSRRLCKSKRKGCKHLRYYYKH